MKRSDAIQAGFKFVRRNLLASFGVTALLLAAAAAAYVRFTHAPPPPSIAPLFLAGSPPPAVASKRPTNIITFAQGCLDSGCHSALATAPVVHAPTATNACEQCHAPDAGGHRYPLLRTGTALCSACHDQTLSRGAHPGTQDQSCLECHTPHASQSPGLLRGNSTKATCNSCHQHANERLQHAPFAAGTCNACHDPHADQPTTAVGQCSTCHEQIVTQAANASHTHSTLKGGCTACHSPHSAANPKLLAAPTRDSCGSCHALAAESMKDASRSHNGVLKDVSCVKCHDAHGSNNTAMLLHSQKAVCLECHSKAIAASNGRTIESMAGLSADSTSHGAISHGECSACHSMHGASHEQAVKLVNQQVPLGPFDVANYALCFSCHDTALTESWSATQFRNDQVNLHQLHLTRAGNQEHSRGCSACHAVHDSTQPRLIATTVNFEGSGWKMPMGFTLTPQGGTCGSSCHV
ncbi:MAG: cytochrome c3 family protein, partial [Planctomycetota bacterium]|nr:cytochrome c3 family protein [Planctomycetota bacterium]